MTIASLILRRTALAAALSLAAGAAMAQTPAPADAAPPPAHAAHTHMTLKERFAQANTTNDGKLTLDQARAGMPMVARHFAAMDKDNKGYVTLDDIHAYLKAQRAARHQTAPDSNG
jgi:ABC-type nitrate/sulfonate/bicarbonate transport system substrate-binding protein